MKEKWKYINGTNNKFMVSNTGKIKGCERYTPFKNSRRFVPEKIFKASKNNSGYLTASLSIAIGEMKSVLVHRVVAEHFTNKPKNNYEVNHKDGNKLNNNYSNLEWTNRSKNQIHAYETGLNHSKKIICYTKDLNGNIRSFPSLLIASKELNVCRRNMNNCFKKPHYRLKGYLFSKTPFNFHQELNLK